MAETKTVRKKATTKEVATETNVNVKDEQAELIKALMTQIQEQNEQMNLLKKQIEESKVNAQPIIVKQENGFSGKKIKCINLMHNPINVSTEPNGRGRVYTFERYGDTRMIKFDELSDIVSSYPYTMEHGMIYICNPEVVEIFGLTDEYNEIYTKEMLDSITYLKEESDVDLFIGMEKNLQKSTAIEIARLLNNGERMDYNYLQRIKEECKINIQKIADDIKKEYSKETDGEIDE